MGEKNRVIIAFGVALMIGLSISIQINSIQGHGPSGLVLVTKLNIYKEELKELVDSAEKYKIEAGVLDVKGPGLNKNQSIEMFYKAFVSTVEFDIGTNGSKIIDKWGEPNQKANFVGGLLLSYQDTYFFTDGILSNRGITYGDVIGIYYTGDEALYGIHTGMSFEQIEAILGKPNDQYTSQNSEIYNENNLILIYRTDNYKVEFELGGESKTVQSISIWKEEK